MSKNIRSEIVIVGGGLSGLMAGWQLGRAGLDAVVVEARSRFGGRVWTVGNELGATCDMGPSWFWQGQPMVAGLLKHFGIGAYEQFAEGKVLYQHPDGQITHTIYESPMKGSLRIEGGVNAIVDALVNDIEPEKRLVEHMVTGLTLADDVVLVDVESSEGMIQIEAKQVAVAIPPRLGAELTFSPVLPDNVTVKLRQTPTWMAGHAKFFAVYERPFWREQGFCGTAMSRRGPLAEIHDASPNEGNAFCLFGFSGLDGASRGEMGREAFIEHATAQLVTLFGEEAGEPKAVYFQDWSAEAFTASEADRRPQTRHPDYGLSLDLGDHWGDKLAFISSETSFTNGGLIEGALEAGFNYAQQIAKIDLESLDGEKMTHSASMDWEWLAKN